MQKHAYSAYFLTIFFKIEILEMILIGIINYQSRILSVHKIIIRFFKMCYIRNS